MDDSTPLSLATDQQIVDELDRRSNAILLVLLRDAPKVGHHDDVFICWRGGVYTALGLAEKFRHVIMNATGDRIDTKGKDA